MNEIVNTFVFAGDRFIPETHLRQPAALNKPGFAYSARWLLTKNKKKEYKNLKKQNISGHIRQIK